MSRTYKAVQATQPGKLEVVERSIVEPAFGQVRIRVEACEKRFGEFAVLKPKLRICSKVFRQSAFARFAASIKLSVVFERNFLR
jgi:hypothetical protein